MNHSHNLKITGIMACDPQGTIGQNSKLPWHYPDDLQHFINITERGIMIMGYNTFISMPGSVLQKNRLNVVFTVNHRNIKLECDNIILISSLQEFSELNQLIWAQHKSCFMIGGAKVATLFLQNKLLTEFILTIINKNYLGDVRLPLELLDNSVRAVIKYHPDFTVYRYTLNT